MAGPLDGIKMLDMARMGPGPFCAMVLGDMGADIIRIEEPVRGATRGGRTMTPAAMELPREYASMGRNARCICLNLRDERARNILYKLAETADIMQEGFRPGVVKRLGVDYETLKKINPGIVYASLSGYGQDGPYINRVGHDLNYESVGGLAGMNGAAGGPPPLPGTIIADLAGGGMHATIGILLALFHRQRTGQGQYVDMAMTDGIVSLVAGHLATYFGTGEAPRRGEWRLGGLYSCYNIYETQDGKYVSIGALEPWFWENVCDIVGRPEYKPLQYPDDAKRDAMLADFRAIFRTKPRDEWVRLLAAVDTCVAPVYTLDEMVNDPQLLHRQMIIDVDTPDGRKVKQVGHFVKLSETPGSVRRLQPIPGEHTDEVLTGIGYKKDYIEQLRAEGAIR